MTAFADLTHLVRLRFTMLSTAGKIGISLASLCAVLVTPMLMASAVWAGPRMKTADRLQISEVLPGAYLVAMIGIVIAAIASSGGRELFPRGQLLVFPVSPFTEHLSIALLTPANLAWWLQVAGLVMLTGVTTTFEASGSVSLLVPALVTFGVCWAWVLASSALAQVMSWLVELVRVQRGGPWMLRIALVLVVVTAYRSANATTLTKVLGWGPSTWLVETTMLAADGVYLPALQIGAALLVVAVALTGVGGLLYAVIVRQPARDQTRSETNSYRPRALVAEAALLSDVRVWRRQDWSMIWRAVPLRRGLLVIGTVPIAGGLLAQVGARDLVLMTGVVAAGAGLIIGVNAMALDAEGAPLRASMPTAAGVWYWSRAWVLAEMIAVTALVATAAAALGAKGEFTPVASVAAIAAVPTMTLSVLSRCLRWSVTRPARAELRTSRDSPASPGRLVAYSGQLIGATLGLGVLLAITARVPFAWAPLVIALPSCALNVWSILRTARRFEDATVRAFLVQAVSRG